MEDLASSGVIPSARVTWEASRLPELQAEPDEALFHALRGDVRAVQNRWSDALINYNRAVDRNPGYFYPLMRRGLTFRRLGNIMKQRLTWSAVFNCCRPRRP